MQNTIHQNISDDVFKTENIIEVEQKEKVVIQSNLFFHSGDGKSNMGKWAKWCNDKNRKHLFANSEQHVWNVCINWSYLFEISRIIARKVAWAFKASGDLLILNLFRFLRRHEFRICIFELRIFQILFEGAFKEIFGPMKEDWKFKNSFFGDEYNLIISVALFHISYESYFIYFSNFNLKSFKALSFTAPIELCYSHHWYQNWWIKK